MEGALGLLGQRRVFCEQMGMLGSRGGQGGLRPRDHVYITSRLTAVQMGWGAGGTRAGGGRGLQGLAGAGVPEKAA